MSVEVSPVAPPWTLGVVDVNGEEMILCMDVTNGATYAIEYTTNLVTGSWETLVGGIEGDGTLCFTNALTNSQSFYRAVSQ